jgi:hypothetical protein
LCGTNAAVRSAQEVTDMGASSRTGMFLRQSSRVRRGIKALFLTAVSVACLAVSGPASADLFGAEAQDGGHNLYRINPTTGVGALIGDMGLGVTGLAVRPSTGALYGSTATGNLAGTIGRGSLVIINPTTGAPTLVGSFGLGGTSTLADLSFDPSTGLLYGWSSGPNGDLYTVNLATGAATKVGESNLTLMGGNGLAFNEAGSLYFVGSGTQGALRTVVPATGLTIAVATLNGYAGCGCTGGEPIGALAFDGSTLYGVSAFAHDLLTINVVTGLISPFVPLTTIGPTGSTELSIDAIAFSLPGPSQVPEPAVLTLTVSGVAALILRRTCRRKQRT